MADEVMIVLPLALVEEMADPFQSHYWEGGHFWEDGSGFCMFGQCASEHEPHAPDCVLTRFREAVKTAVRVERADR